MSGLASGMGNWERFEKARMVKAYIGNIRAAYTRDFTSANGKKRQRAVVTYLIDRCGTASASICTLKVDNVKPIFPNKLQFNYGNHSINEITFKVERPVYKAIKQFRAGKCGSDDLFDKFDPGKWDKYLKNLMPGLTSSVFRRYNASIRLDNILNKETEEGDVLEKPLIVFLHAMAEATYCIFNFPPTLTIPECHSAYCRRTRARESELAGLKSERNWLQSLNQIGSENRPRIILMLARVNPKIKNYEALMRLENNWLAFGMLWCMKNYCEPWVIVAWCKRHKVPIEKLVLEGLLWCMNEHCDPRIVVAWCKRHDLPFEKIFGEGSMQQFARAMNVGPDFRF